MWTSCMATPVAATMGAGQIWPTQQSGVHYSTPIAATKGFAAGVLGINDPLVGAYHATGPKVGVVAMRTSANGPTTTVHLVDCSGWTVTGSTFGQVRVAIPISGAEVGTSFRVAGVSTAFESVVNYRVRSDVGTVLARGIVKGGSNGAYGPFRATVERAPAKGAGELIFSTRSAKDGSLLGATVIRVRF